MGILNKNLPPPPAPIELTPEQIEDKRRLEAEEAKKQAIARRIEAEEAEKQAVARRLEEARKRLGKLSPVLIEDIRLVCNAAVDEVASRSAGCGIPFEVLRRDLVGRAGGCACSEFMMIADQVK